MNGWRASIWVPKKYLLDGHVIAKQLSIRWAFWRKYSPGPWNQQRAQNIQVWGLYQRGKGKDYETPEETTGMEFQPLKKI